MDIPVAWTKAKPSYLGAWKPKRQKQKADEWDFIKIENFCTSKGHLPEGKNTDQSGENVRKSHT